MQSNEPIRVEEVTLDRFKNQTRSERLDRLNLIVGDNGSGKTAVPLALMFAATGATPDGKKIDSAYEYTDPSGCKVGLRMTDGFAFDREIIADHRDRSLSQAITIRGRRDALSNKAAEAAIEAALGAMPAMWNANEFLGLSPKAKRNELLSMFAGTSADMPVDATAVMARLVAEFVRLHHRGGDGAADAILASIADAPVAEQCNIALSGARLVIDHADESAMLAAKLELLRSGIQGDIAEAVAAMVEAAKKEANATEADHRSTRQALSELSSRKASLTVVAEDCRALKERDAAYEADEQAVIRDIGNAEGREKSETAIRQRIGTLEQRIADSRNSLRAVQETTAPTQSDIDSATKEYYRLGAAIRIAELRAEAEHLNSALSLAADNPNDPAAMEAEADALEANLPEADDGPRQRATAEVERLTTAEAAAGRRVNAIIQTATQARADVATCSRRLEEARKSPWAEARDRLEEAIAELGTEEAASVLSNLMGFIVSQEGAESADALATRLQQLSEHATVCDAEAVKAKDDHLRLTNERLAAENIARIERDKAAVVQAERTRALQRIAGLRDKATAARNAGGEADKRRADAQARLTAIEIEIADRKASHAPMPVIDDIAAAKARYSAAGDDIDDNRKAMQDRERNIRDLTGSIEADERSLAQAKSELNTLAPVGDLDGLRAKRAAIATARAELKQQIDARTEFEAAERTYADTERRAKAKGIEHEVCKCLHSAVGELRDSMMRRLSKPVTDAMNRFLAYCAPDGAEAYCDIESAIGREACELGWIRSRRKVPIRALSGGERTIFTAALQFALISLADPPYKLLWVEADQCDANNLTRLSAACEAVADSLSQVIITTHATGIMAMQGWNVIRAERVARVPEPALPVAESSIVDVTTAINAAGAVAVPA